MKPFYLFYCEICNWKLVSDNPCPKNLQEFKTASIPTNIPKLDPQTQKIVTSPDKKRLRRFKCPKCGRVFRPKKIANPQEVIDMKQAEVEAKKRRELWELLDQEAKERYERSKQEYDEDQKSDWFN